jgi:hypothetical protein
LVPVTEVQAFTPQPTVAWISWNSTCINAEGVEMLSSLKIGQQEDWEPAHLRTEQQSIRRLESFSVYSGRSRLQCLINTGKKLPKVNIECFTWFNVVPRLSCNVVWNSKPLPARGNEPILTCLAVRRLFQKRNSSHPHLVRVWR